VRLISSLAGDLCSARCLATEGIYGAKQEESSVFALRNEGRRRRKQWQHMGLAAARLELRATTKNETPNARSVWICCFARGSDLLFGAGGPGFEELFFAID
jgi:hypothetical protein